MKKIFLSTFIAATMSTNAQYFEHVYGSTSYEEVSSGMNTSLNGPGFLIGGTRTSTNGANVAISMVRTDINGDVLAAPYFKKNYGIYFNSSLTPVMRIRQAFVTELSHGSFGIVGVCFKDQTLQKYCVYYAQVDQSGVPLPGGPLFNMKYYDIGTDSYYQVRNIRLSASGNELYIVGLSVNNQTGLYYTMVLKIDVSTGNLLWSYIYNLTGDDESAYDAVEDPVTNELVVVGYYDYNWTGADAYVLRLDATTGNPVSSPSTMLFANGGQGVGDIFTCIALRSGGGYLIGGQTNISGNWDTWLVGLDNTFNVALNEQLDYSFSGADNYAIDILERRNTSGQPEIHLAGQVIGGAFGNADIEVYKLDEASGTCMGQFTYGTPAYEYVSAIDQNNSGSADGLSIFGLTELTTPQFANKDFCIFKSYYNGYTSCNYQVNDNSGPILNTPISLVDHKPYDKFNPADAWLQTLNNFNDRMICSDPTVPGGDNSRFTQNAVGLSENALHPTVEMLFDGGNKIVTIKCDQEPIERLTVTDVNGREIMTHKNISNNKYQMDISNLESGIYILRTETSNGTCTNRKFIVNQ